MVCKTDGGTLDWLECRDFGKEELRAEPGRQGAKVLGGGSGIESLLIITWRGYGPPWGRVGPLRLRGSAALPERKAAGKKLWEHNVRSGSVVKQAGASWVAGMCF